MINLPGRHRGICQGVIIDKCPVKIEPGKPGHEKAFMVDGIPTGPIFL
jgi:hypothetical protein